MCVLFWCHKSTVYSVRSLYKLWVLLKVKVAQSCPTLCPHGPYSPWNSPGQNTGVGSLSLLQGIFPTQGSNLGLPHCRRILYQLSHKGSPRILEWVAYPFSKGFSRPRNGTRVSCIAGGFFANWAIKEALNITNDFHLWDVLPSVRPQRKRLETYIFAILFSNFGKYCYPHLQIRR